MYSQRPKVLAYVIVLCGVVLLLAGLWNLIPEGYSSETPSYVFMTLAAIRVLFPILGISLIMIGNVLLMIIKEQRKEWSTYLQELNELRKAVKQQ